MTTDDMNRLAARLMALAKLGNDNPRLLPGEKLAISYSTLIHLRQNRTQWQEFVADLRDPDSGIEKELGPFSQANRETMANFIEAALDAVSEDDVGTA